MPTTPSAPLVGDPEVEAEVVGGAVVGAGAEVTRAAAEASRAEAGVAASLPMPLWPQGWETARVLPCHGPMMGVHVGLAGAGCGIVDAGGRLTGCRYGAYKYSMALHGLCSYAFCGLPGF